MQVDFAEIKNEDNDELPCSHIHSHSVNHGSLQVTRSRSYDNRSSGHQDK